MHDLPSLEICLEGLAYVESPRWHEGALWFSDFYTRQVMRLVPGRSPGVVCEVAGQPSGLGWLPDGRLLVVSMNDRMLLRLDPQGLASVADLSAQVPAACNDMLVDPRGRAYIGNFGFDLHGHAPPMPTVLLMVTPEGEVSVAAEDMRFPNGAVLTPDGGTLIVAETFGQCLTAFDVAVDGKLSNRRVWAQFSGRVVPDGICLDAEGAIWIASPMSREVLRVKEGGEVTHCIATEDGAIACALGGEDGRSLFVSTGSVFVTPEQSLAARTGKIWQLKVDVPAAPVWM
jgi:sugar lactone lactonase YvrE